MIKLTAEKIGKVLNRDKRYIYTLLNRRGLKLRDEDINGVIGLICEQVIKKLLLKDRKTGDK